MDVIKGFLSFPQFANNQPDQTADIGEISTDSLTFSPDVGVYQNTDYPDTLFYAFSVESDNGTTVIDTVRRDTILSLGQFVVNTIKVNGFTDLTRTQAAQKIGGEFSDQLQNVVCGDVVGDNEQCPSWVSFNWPGYSDSFVRIWFSDQQFNREYDVYKVVVIPPITNIDRFFDTRADVQRALDAEQLTGLMDRIATARGNAPYTALRTHGYRWLDPNDESQFIMTYWTAIVYGRAGDDPDKIREAFGEWILETSAYDREDWVNRIPDIFVPTEMIVIPLWDRYAIPNQTIQSGIYSPVVSLSYIDNITRVACKGTGYAQYQREQNTEVVPSSFGGLTLLTVGSEQNRNGVTRFSQLWGDYTNISLSSTDFGRMSQDTQEFIRELNNLLYVAQGMTEYSTIPNGVSRIVRDGIVYTASSIAGMQYMVVAKQSLTQAIRQDPAFDTR